MDIKEINQPNVDLKVQDPYQDLYEELKSRPKKENIEPKLGLSDYISIIPIVVIIWIIESFIIIQSTFFITLMLIVRWDPMILVLLSILWAVIWFIGFLYHGIAEFLMKHHARWFSKLSFTLKYMTLLSWMMVRLYKFMYSTHPLMFAIPIVIMISVFASIQYEITKHHQKSQTTKLRFYVQITLFSILTLIFLLFTFL